MSETEERELAEEIKRLKKDIEDLKLRTVYVEGFVISFTNWLNSVLLVSEQSLGGAEDGARLREDEAERTKMQAYRDSMNAEKPGTLREIAVAELREWLGVHKGPISEFLIRIKEDEICRQVVRAVPGWHVTGDPEWENDAES